MTRRLNTALVIAGLVMLVLIGTMFVDTERTIQKTQIIEKTNPLYPIRHRPIYKDVRAINWIRNGYLNKLGAGHGPAFNCDINFIQS